ncbi:MAG: MFS transporter [Dehalococcoidia bacterium]
MNFSKNQNIYKWWVYSSIAVVIFVQVGDQTGTNIAMPSMSSEFNADIPTVQWVYLLYTLCISSLLLPMGRFSDIFGRKYVYCSGLVVFIIGGIVATISTNFPMLLIARAIQGIAVSMILANGMALLVEAFPKSERGLALGLYLSVIGMGGLLGTILSGYLVSEYGWRALYMASVFVSSGGLILSLFVLKKNSSVKLKSHSKFDWYGAIFSAGTLASFLLSMTFSHTLGWGSFPVLMGFLISVFCLIMFVWRERVFDSPMIDLSLFRNPVFFVGTLGRFLTFMAGSSVFFLMPFYIIQVMGLSAFTAAVLSSPMPIMMTLTSPLSGKISDKYGTKWPTLCGLFCWGLAIFISTTLTVDSTPFAVLLIHFLAGAGNGIFQSPNQSSIVSVVSSEKYGVVTSVISMVRTAGNLTGTAVATSVVVLTMSSMGLEPNLSILETVSDPQKIAEIRFAFTEGISRAFMLATAIVVISFSLNIFGPNIKFVSAKSK